MIMLDQTKLILLIHLYLLHHTYQKYLLNLHLCFYKLIIYYKYLSHYTEDKKVIKMCKNYLKNTQKQFEPVYFIFLKFKYDENVKNYLKENGFTYFDDQVTRGWYSFFDKEDQYNEFQSEILRIKNLMPKISLDFIYSGEVLTT